jgi:methylmalonyl-CoA/ethylmalonyl-CoA epimerase
VRITFELDHIGVAVESLAKGRLFYEALGLGEMTVEEVPSEKVKVGFFETENQARIELLEATDESSPIRKFLSSRGPGIHHICFKVNGLRAILQTLKAKGIQLINEEPRPGAHGCMVAFIHPKSTGGILIELSEPQGEKR